MALIISVVTDVMIAGPAMMIGIGTGMAEVTEIATGMMAETGTMTGTDIVQGLPAAMIELVLLARTMMTGRTTEETIGGEMIGSVTRNARANMRTVMAALAVKWGHITIFVNVLRHHGISVNRCRRGLPGFIIVSFNMVA